MNQEVERLFTAALDLPESARAVFVESQTADPAIRDEVLSLLLHNGLAEPFFDGAIRGEASDLASLLDLEKGRAIGNYRVISLLGRGGMGSVYLAEPADGNFEQRAAVKVIRSPNSGTLLIERFHQERRIQVNRSALKLLCQRV